MALTAKQERFVAEYLIDGNATRAATAAGYSKKTAHSVGSENLRKPDIVAKIAAAQADRTERTHITIDYVIQRLAIEAEREGEGTSHSARVSALGQLRQHFVDAGGGGGADKVADALCKIADKLPG
ncbi:MAG: terminase small subunit [Paracoccaceae bacterium]